MASMAWICLVWEIAATSFWDAGEYWQCVVSGIFLDDWANARIQLREMTCKLKDVGFGGTFRHGGQTTPANWTVTGSRPRRCEMNSRVSSPVHTRLLQTLMLKSDDRVIEWLIVSGAKYYVISVGDVFSEGTCHDSLFADANQRSL
jgi:hypothetical protein